MWTVASRRGHREARPGGDRPGVQPPRPPGCFVTDPATATPPPTYMALMALRCSFTSHRYTVYLPEATAEDGGGGAINAVRKGISPCPLQKGLHTHFYLVFYLEAQKARWLQPPGPQA